MSSAYVIDDTTKSMLQHDKLFTALYSLKSECVLDRYLTDSDG